MKIKNIKSLIVYVVVFFAVIGSTSFATIEGISFYRALNDMKSNMSQLESDCVAYNDYIVVLGDMETESLEAVVNTLTVFQPELLDIFIQDNGLIVVCDNLIEQSETYFNCTDVTKSTRGLYLRLNNRPLILIDGTCAKYNTVVMNNVVLHEFAHYKDAKYSLSSTAEFKEYFDKYAENYVPKLPVDLGYQATNEKEFFACVASDYLRMQPEALEEHMPKELIQYLKDCYSDIK